MKLAIASEHAGFEMKEKIISHLKDKGLEVDDIGAQTDEPIDYPYIAADLAEKVADGQYDKGILLCGTGIGMTMAAGKVPGVRAALCTNAYMAKMTREHNDANVLCLGAWITGERLTYEIVDAFLSHDFQGGRHLPRVNKIKELEDKYFGNCK